MIEDYEDDTHFCLKCHSTLIGLDNYVTHRKTRCGKDVNQVDTQNSLLISSEDHPNVEQQDEPISLKADDFFSSLELQSSSKKQNHPTTGGKTVTGIWTRSKTFAITQAASISKELEPSKSGKNAWIGGHQLKELGSGDNQTKLIKAVDNLSRHSGIKKDEPASNNIDVYEESDEESFISDYDEDDEDYEENQDCPPRSHTGDFCLYFFSS